MALAAGHQVARLGGACERMKDMRQPLTRGEQRPGVLGCVTARSPAVQARGFADPAEHRVVAYTRALTVTASVWGQNPGGGFCRRIRPGRIRPASSYRAAW